MPVLTYQCTICHHRFEKLLPRYTEEKQPCPECVRREGEKAIAKAKAVMVPSVPSKFQWGKAGGWS